MVNALSTYGSPSITISDVELGERWHLVQEKYLITPNKNDDPRYVWLKQLADPACKPYMEEDERVFEIARTTLTRTNKWLGLRGYGVITIIAGGLVVLSSRVMGPYIKDDDRWDALVAVLFGVAATELSNVCSMLFTGTFPHISSNSQNADQNSLLRIKDRFTSLAQYMLLQFASGNRDNKNEMIRIASTIDVEQIRAKIREVTTQKDEVENVVKFFEDTLSYFNSLNKDMPNTSFNTELEIILRNLNLQF